ncbi:MAG: DNA adenine methylase [Planctomycetaceae bacterium]|jgi:adenine-specific DNA-methyltransferase|nr:DNA adenine methylase [Planctomycetaceae bacterium]
MNYIGSKYSLLDFLETSIENVAGKNGQTFCDLFAGTGAVGSHFKKLGYKITANDIQYYSYVLNRHYIGNSKPMRFNGLADIITSKMLPENPAAAVCDYLSQLDGTEGFLYKNYAPTGSQKNGTQRIYFSDENAMKCDAVRTQIEDWKTDGKITENEYYFLLASLLESIDARANTASIYGAFLKKLKKTARKPLQLRAVNLIEDDKDHDVYQSDVNVLIKKISGDIFYLDPPYNHRQYGANYHLLETAARYDSPSIHGKTGLRDEEIRSAYCLRSSVKQAFTDLIMNADAKYIFVSYNNEGIMPLDDIQNILGKRGEYGCFTKQYRRFKADAETNRRIGEKETTEYLHYVKVK